VADLLKRPGPAAPASQRGRDAAPHIPATTPMSPAYLMQILANVRPRDAIVVEESPSSRGDMQRHLPILAPDSFFTCASGGLGHGLPAAVGVALGRPGSRVIALLGDGSAMYSIQGLWSAAQLALPICFVILNNGRYEALRHFANRFELPQTVGTELGGMDFAGLAESLGCRGYRVETPATLEATLRTAFAASGPTLVEVIVA
jgi:benzoylformate decarboxylase